MADLYLQFGKPDVFEIEPDICPEYRPDVYMVLDDRHIVIEYQRTVISQSRMQAKLDAFFRSHIQGRHDSRELWIVSGGFKYKVVSPSDYTIRQIEKAPGA